MSVYVSPTIDVSGTFPLNHARIGYKNYVPDALVTGSSESVGFEADSVQNQLTYEYWKPASLPAELVIDMTTSKSINYIGLAAHTLTDVNVTVSYSGNGADYTTLDVSAIPADNSAIMLLFNAVSARFIKLGFESNLSLSLDFIEEEYSFYDGSENFSLGVVYAGLTLDMYRPFYAGHTPDSFGRKTTYKPTKSVSGKWVGRSIIRTGYMNSYEWKNIPIDWYRANIDPFAVSAQKYPFFIAWNILEEPEDCLYSWVSADIAPSLSGRRDLVDFSFEVEGLGDE